MTYISGTITNANPAATLYAAVDTALSSAGYTLVDTVAISTRTHKVWKSPAASNAANLDWYLDVAYTTTGAGHIGFYPFEDYNATTHVAYRGMYGEQTSWTPDATYYSRFGSTGSALETNWLPNGSGGGNAQIQTTLPTTAFGYWISITTSRVIAMYSTVPTSVYYTGLYTPSSLQTSNAAGSLFPLIGLRLDGTGIGGNYNYGMTRVPKIITTINGYMSAYAAAPYAVTLPSIPGGITTASGGYFASPIWLFTYSGFPNTIWGTLIDVKGAQTDATVTRADTVSIGGETWLLGQRVLLNGYYVSALFKAV